MAEVATVARPYAEALFQSVGASPDASAWVEELAQIAADEELLQFADNPKVSSDQVMSVIQSVVRTQLTPQAVNFLQLVVENGRLPVLSEIAAQYRALSNAKSGVADAVVQSAFPLNDGQLSDLSGVLEKRFARKLNLSVDVTPELIGGVRVVVGDEVLDTSIKARLEQMKAALTA
jgi:F-type H+-transporting ATPase subunit delta